MSKKSPYQIGTRIRIINPEFFVRCGYPETLQSAKEKFRERFKEKHGKELNRFLDDLIDIDGERKLDTPIFTHSYFREWEIEKIADIFARAYNREFLRFGGTERKVYTKRKEEYAGEICYIDVFDQALIKKTGEYYPPSGGYDSWSGEYDYVPGGLENMKTHVFYPITRYRPLKYGNSYDSQIKHLRAFTDNTYKNYIEKTNFEILEDDEDNDELFEG